jgi:hypothetical protein
MVASQLPSNAQRTLLRMHTQDMPFPCTIHADQSRGPQEPSGQRCVCHTKVYHILNPVDLFSSCRDENFRTCPRNHRTRPVQDQSGLKTSAEGSLCRNRFNRSTFPGDFEACGRCYLPGGLYRSNLDPVHFKGTENAAKPLPTGGE